jgi:hypothetical protein
VALNGVDADVFAQSTKGAFQMARSDSNQRIEAIARIFAETGMAGFYNSLHSLVDDDIRTGQPSSSCVTTGFETNPADWNERTDLTCVGGLR